MKKYVNLLLSILLISLFLFTIGFARTGTKVYINKVNSPDGGLIEPAKSQLINKLMGKGFVITEKKDEANYLIDLVIVSANSKRSFNWLILIFPAWPLVPFTTVQGEAIVALRIYDQAGNEVLFDQTGAVRNGMWFFGDFVSGSSVIKGAVNDCINILTSRMNLQ